MQACSIYIISRKEPVTDMRIASITNANQVNIIIKSCAVFFVHVQLVLVVARLVFSFVLLLLAVSVVQHVHVQQHQNAFIIHIINTIYESNSSKSSKTYLLASKKG